MLAHIACLWQVNDIYCFLWSLFAKRNRSWWAAFHWWNSLVNSFGSLVCKRLNTLSVSASRRSPKTRMQLSLIYLRFADFRMIRISALPVANLYLTLKRRLNGRFSEVRALKSQFSDAKWNLGLVDILILGQTFTCWQLFSRAIQHETWPSFICFGLRITKKCVRYTRSWYTLWLVNFDSFCQQWSVFDHREECDMAVMTVTRG